MIDNIEEIDYSDFDEVDEIKSEEINPMWQIICHEC